MPRRRSIVSLPLVAALAGVLAAAPAAEAHQSGTPGRVHLDVVQQFALVLSNNGAGVGTVTSAPAGILCGAKCAAQFDEGTTVTLTATPITGSRFVGWSGAGSSGTGTCVVTMSQDRSVTATFSLLPPPPDADGDGVPDASDPAPDDPSIPTGFGATNGDDSVQGTAIGETICGLLGDDFIEALGGDDTVFGDGCGVRKGPGGNDLIDGGTGDDRLYGAGGNDRIDGGAGDDVLKGDKGRDRLAGGKGKDRLAGGGGVNRFFGGGGDDRLSARNDKQETVDCGGGRKDVAVVDKGDRVRGCERVKRA